MLDPIVKIGENQDLGEAIQSLIEDNIARLNKCYLAKVEAVNENKVDVSFVIGEDRLIIPSLLVGIPLNAGLKLSGLIKAGDVGICLVCDNDITAYAQSGSEGKAITKRSHSLIDSIFIPLNLFESDLAKNAISSEAGIEIEAKEVLKLVASQFTLKNESESLKSLLKEFITILKEFKTAPVANGSPAVLDPSLIAKVAVLENRIEGFFDE